MIVHNFFNETFALFVIRMVAVFSICVIIA